MYDEYAFGAARLKWDDSELQRWRDEPSRDETIQWLTQAHERFVDNVHSLPDDELSVLRLANWGEHRELGG
jgi:hypothetical protein